MWILKGEITYSSFLGVKGLNKKVHIRRGLYLPIGVLFKLKATAFAIRLSLNSIHPSVNNFLPLPPYFFLFFLTAASTKRGKQYSLR